MIWAASYVHSSTQISFYILICLTCFDGTAWPTAILNSSINKSSVYMDVNLILTGSSVSYCYFLLKDLHYCLY